MTVTLAVKSHEDACACDDLPRHGLEIRLCEHAAELHQRWMIRLHEGLLGKCSVLLRRVPGILQPSTCIEAAWALPARTPAHAMCSIMHARAVLTACFIPQGEGQCDAALCACYLTLTGLFVPQGGQRDAPPGTVCGYGSGAARALPAGARAHRV